MTEDRNEKNKLIRYRIQESEETIEDVKLLIENAQPLTGFITGCFILYWHLD